jgi:hypothetical protein
MATKANKKTNVVKECARMDFEEWASSSEGRDFDEDVLQYMGDCHGHRMRSAEEWNQIASQCVMEVAFP